MWTVSPPPFSCRNICSIVNFSLTLRYQAAGLSLQPNILIHMILPIVAYGSPILRKACKDITPDEPGLNVLLENMWETLYHSSGVGLAAPQINRDIRVFLVDSCQIFENQDESEQGQYPDEPGYKGVFINARILSLEGRPWSYNEGCLSIPGVREDVSREESVTLEFQNETFETLVKTFRGITARIILHEYDHIEGRLFIDHISALKRTLLRRKLEDISKGRVRTDYRMVFHKS